MVTFFAGTFVGYVVGLVVSEKYRRSGGKHVAERAEEASLVGPVSDGKDHLAEPAGVGPFECAPEVAGGAKRVVPEGAAPPGAEDEGLVSVQGRQWRVGISRPPAAGGTAHGPPAWVRRA